MFVPSFMKISQRVSELLSRHDFVTDRWKDRRPGKNNISSSLNGGDNVLDSFITIITTKMLNKMLVYLPKADT